MKVYDGAFITLMHGDVDVDVNMFGRGDWFVGGLGVVIIDGIGGGDDEVLSFCVRYNDEYDEDSVAVVVYGLEIECPGDSVL